MRFPVTIKGETLSLGDRAKFAAYIKRCKDGAYMLKVERQGETRSPQANSWYWAGLGEIAKEAGYDEPQELHQIFKARFLASTDDKGHPHIASTATLTTHEFLTYLEKINRLCIDMFGCDFPLPKEMSNA